MTSDALIMAAEALKASPVQQSRRRPSPPLPSAAESGPTCLISGSALEARGASAAPRSDTLNELHHIIVPATTHNVQ